MSSEGDDDDDVSDCEVDEGVEDEDEADDALSLDSVEEVLFDDDGVVKKRVRPATRTGCR